MRFMLGHLDNTHPSPQPAIVHADVELPTILFLVVYLNCLQVGGAVKATNRHQLTVDHCEPDLVTQIQSDRSITIKLRMYF